MIACDIQICVGCRECEVACSAFHFGAVSPSLARIRVAKLEEIGIDLAVACISCAEKPCLECPSEALAVGAMGEILLRPGQCNGCGACADACPIGAAGFYGEQPLFCDLCGGAPACVAVCPTRALSFGEDYRLTSLAGFRLFQGGAGERRANYARVQGAPLRAGWRAGKRVDS
jgi:anaerobic carbon-monoxide dehydrogenase iron sulfur subunit